MKLNIRKKVQKGFTLIEVMIAVAIVALLASWAAVDYTDFVIRAQLSEGIVLAKGAQVAIEDYYAQNGKLPTSDSELNIDLTNGAYSGKYSYVEKVFNGIVIVAYDKSKYTNSNVGNYTLGLEAVPDAGGNIHWKCGAYSSNDEKYFPSSCREDLDRSGYQ